MKTCFLTLALATACLVANGQHWRNSRNSSDCDDKKYSRYDDDEDDDDRNRRRKSRYAYDEEEDRGKRRSAIVITEQNGRWKVDRFDAGKSKRNNWRDDDGEEHRLREPNRQYNRNIFTFGPKIGVNYASLVKNPVVLDADYQVGYHVGAFMRFNVRRAYIQPEVLYSTKGADLTLPETPGAAYRPGTYAVTINTIDVPLLLGARLVNTRSFNLRAFAGPMVSFNVGGSGLDDFLGEGESTKSYLETVGLSYQAGIGFDFGALTLDTRYEWGVTGAANLERADLGKPRNGLFQASLGIKIF